MHLVGTVRTLPWNPTNGTRVLLERGYTKYVFPGKGRSTSLLFETFSLWGDSDSTAWADGHSCEGLSSYWVSSTGVSVPWIPFLPFTREHSLVTWEGSYLLCIGMGGTLLGQGRKKDSVWSARLALWTRGMTHWIRTPWHPHIIQEMLLGLNESLSRQHQEPQWTYCWYHIPIHTSEFCVSFSSRGGFRDWIALYGSFWAVRSLRTPQRGFGMAESFSCHLKVSDQLEIPLVSESAPRSRQKSVRSGRKMLGKVCL